MKRLKSKPHKLWNHHKCSIINPICLKWVPIWHSLPFSCNLRDGFCTESEDVELNRVNNTTSQSNINQSTLNQQATLRHVNWVFVYHERSQKIFHRFLYLSTFSRDTKFNKSKNVKKKVVTCSPLSEGHLPRPLSIISVLTINNLSFTEMFQKFIQAITPNSSTTPEI